MIEVGARVFDKYEILRRLAVGGTGEIFLASLPLDSVRAARGLPCT